MTSGSNPDKMETTKEAATMKVGFRTGSIQDPTRPDWDGSGSRPVSWAAWYPAPDVATEAELVGGGPAASWFTAGPVARDAPVRAAGGPWPVVLISHGTGGSALGMGWLGRRLAQRGLVALVPDHHGNTAGEPYRAEGFLCWWERAADLSVLLDRVTAEDGLGPHLDAHRTDVVGFSLGAHTALSVLGAVTDMGRFRAWAGDTRLSRGPREFPDLSDRFSDLMANSAVFRASWGRQSARYRDARIRKALLLAPAPPVRAFTEESLAAIAAPVAIMTGGADREAPLADGAAWLKALLPRCEVDIVAPEAGHFVFLPEATEAGRREAPDLCQDPPGIDRRAIHEAVATAAATLFGS